LPAVWHTDDTDKTDLHNLKLNPDSAKQKRSVPIRFNRVIRVIKSWIELLQHKGPPNAEGTVI